MVPVYNRLPRNSMDAQRDVLLPHNNIHIRTTEPASQQTGGEAPPVVFLTDSL